LELHNSKPGSMIVVAVTTQSVMHNIPEILQTCLLFDCKKVDCKTNLNKEAISKAILFDVLVAVHSTPALFVCSLIGNSIMFTLLWSTLV
jgi:hypothetical protein